MNSHFIQTARRGLFITLAMYTLLVATHLGEFWPFSIFPMFSQAGNPWTRSLVRQVPEDRPTDRTWKTVSLEELPGEPLRLAEQGINQNDVANFVSKTRAWNEQRLRGLRHLLEVPRINRTLHVYRVRGRLGENAVEITAEPLILFAPDTTFTAPSINISP